MTTLSSERKIGREFPIARLALSSSPGRLRRFDEALDMLDSAINAGAIANQVHIEIKSRFRTALGAAWDSRVASLVHRQEGPLLDLYFSIQSDALHLLESSRQKIAASKLEGPAIDAMRSVLAEFDPIGQAMAGLKDKVTKRLVKTDEERQAETRFVPTPATPAGTRIMYDALVDITGRNFKSLVGAINSDYAARLAKYMAAEPGERRKLYAQPEYRSAVVAAVKGSLQRTDQVDLRADWEAQLLALATRDATYLRETFIAKVLRKLAPIVEEKGDLLSAREIGNSVTVARLSGTIKVEFSDGSSFLADNNVVYSHSPLGKLFARFPLTFHQVVMADGSLMKSPCEERMHTVFARESVPIGVPDDEDTDEPEAPRV